MLLTKAKTDNAALEKLLDEYEPFLSYLTAKIDVEGYQREDLLQEARAAFCTAVKTFRADGGAKFSTYAATCVNHRLGDLRKGSMADKRKGAVYSLDIKEDVYLDYLASDEPGPEEKVLELEQKETFASVIKNSLTDFEYKVTLLFLEGLKYKDIAERLAPEYPDASAKSVDNALTRVRNKLKEIL